MNVRTSLLRLVCVLLTTSTGARAACFDQDKMLKSTGLGALCTLTKQTVLHNLLTTIAYI